MYYAWLMLDWSMWIVDNFHESLNYKSDKGGFPCAAFLPCWLC